MSAQYAGHRQCCQRLQLPGKPAGIPPAGGVQAKAPHPVALPLFAVLARPSIIQNLDQKHPKDINPLRPESPAIRNGPHGMHSLAVGTPVLQHKQLLRILVKVPGRKPMPPQSPRTARRTLPGPQPRVLLLPGEQLLDIYNAMDYQYMCCWGILGNGSLPNVCSRVSPPLLRTGYFERV